LEALEHSAALEFVRTPFTVRCNVVKVWRPLPRDLWSLLGSQADVRESRRRERVALVAVLLMAVMIAAGSTGLGHRWLHAPGPPVAVALWVVVPPLMGWVFVRSVWIPLATVGQPAREAAKTFARHLSGVYLYVYLMIAVGAALVLLLARVAPAQTGVLRYCLWWFLFGESCFVPTVMWLRLVRNDSSGCVFGRSRNLVLVLYLISFVALPAVGMCLEFTEQY
jgi:hypothetical protein